MDRREALRTGSLAAGAALAMPTLLTLLQSCRDVPRLSWQPEFLTEREAVFLAALIDTVLPRTDTPGGLDVKADVFMDKVFARGYNDDARGRIREGLASLDASCRDAHGSDFASLGQAGRVAFLTAAESEGATFNPGVWGTTVGEQEPVSFYRTLKSMAVWAWSSSEEVGRNVLSYDPIPGRFDGCIPLSEVGNRWSL